MDYDDTDLQSQKFQLASEDNNKFPSGLRPFALPKLDIDDQLQGHLRFDNLIDSEGIFSVEGHDNSWIEVLSTGSSVVDFSSGAAESCSISRTNYVWSEATSSECVEMLLKSVGETEMTGNMDGNARQQVHGMDSQIDPSNTQPKSSGSPTGSIAVPTENNQSQMVEGPSRVHPQLEHITPFSTNEKGENAAGSALSDRKSNYMLESNAVKCFVSERLSSALENTSESRPATGNYFEVVQHDDSLDNLNMRSAGVDLRKLNDEPFSELAPIQNIYATESYRFKQDNEESGVGVSAQGSAMHHMNENKLGGEMHELQNLSCPSQPLGSTSLHNETLLSESSDGLLEAITNPVKMLHRNEDMHMRASAAMQPSFSQVEHAVEGLKGPADTSNELVIEKFSFSEEPNSGKSRSQSEPDSRNSIPHVGTPFSTESDELIQSPNGKQLPHAPGVPEETKNDGVVDTIIKTGDDSELGVLEQHQDSVGNLKIVVMDDANTKTGDDSKPGVLEREDSVDHLKGVVTEENPIGEEISAVSGNVEHVMRTGHDKNATGSSKDKFDSSDNVVSDNSSARLLDENDPNISSVNNTGSSKEDATPALEDEPEKQQLAPRDYEPQEKMSAPSNISSSNLLSATDTDTSNTPKDKLDCSGGVASDNSAAGTPDENVLRVSGTNQEGANSASEVGDHNKISPAHESCGTKPAMSVDSNIDAVCSSATDAVAKKVHCEEHATSFGSLTMNSSPHKSGDQPDAHAQKCQTDGPLIQSEHHENLHPQTSQTEGPLVQSEHHENLIIPSSSGVSPDKTPQNIVETPLNVKVDLNEDLQDKVINHGADHTPGTVSSQSRAGLDPGSGGGSSNDANCGSPTVISCSEPCPQEGGQGGSALLRNMLTEQSEDPKDSAASADASQSSKDCSAIITKPTPSSEENSAVGDDRSFSFEVAEPPKVSEKAHSPAWSPFPRPEAAKSIKATTEVPEPRSSSGTPLKNTSEHSKKISALETEKEQPSRKKAVGKAGGLSITSHIGDSAQTKSASLQHPKHHPTRENIALVDPPFTDLQHVQLRAQIFVYGALIQGIPPAEAYMVSAFGEPGDSKPAWETVWRAAVERFQHQKSPLAGLETPTSARIGSRVAEKASKSTAVKTAPTSKKSGKTVLAAHPSVALHSPTFNISPLGNSTLNLQRGTHLDFSQAASPAFTYSSQTRQPISAASQWLSPGPHSSPWLIPPPQNLIFDSSMQPTVPASETAKGAYSKNASLSQAVSAGVFLPSQASPTVSPPLAVLPEEKQKASASTSKRGARATSQRPRKRKKASASAEQQPDIASPQLKTDIASVTPPTKHKSAFTLSTPSASNVLGSGLIPSTSLITSVPNFLGGKNAEQRIVFSEQISSAIEQSREQAKGASMHSMEAIRHSEGVWSHLSTYSTSNLPAEVEQKVTSAAAAASAAVSVAKAAAEAAKLASEAALHAKLMAEEALSSSKYVNSLQKRSAGEYDVNNNPASLSSTPKSSRRVKDSTHGPGSTFSVAREVARKRVEEASAATKRAENLDAILKAAEFAAEAVFKAGTIIGMGEPLPFTLSELLEAGPDGYWKSDRVKNNVSGNTTDIVVTEQSELPNNSSKSGRKHGSKAKYDQTIQKSEPSSSVKELQPDKMHSGTGIVDVPTTTPFNGNTNDTSPSIIWNGIGKGSLVEVFADEGGSSAAWFSAKVLDINEDSACISYDTNGEGTVPRKEWVPLKQEGKKAPQIRLAHPVSLSKFKGSKKRRRDTTGNYSWAIGDHVDAWIKNSWREGVIFQNCEADETKFVVQFSGGGGDSLVDAWNLRQSLVWKDGQWTEWSRVVERKDKSNKGDSPYEKRQKTAVSDHMPIAGEAGGPSKDKSTSNATKREELKPLGLSEKDMVFDIGKSTVENKTTRRHGLQKEGSKVVYGVPKPGKKKKFMDVSKHYVGDQTDKSSEGNTSTRSARHLMPQVPRPRESSLKVDRGRRISDMRSRGKRAGDMPVPSSSVLGSNHAFTGNTAVHSNTAKPSVEKNNSSHGTSLRIDDSSVPESQIPTGSTAKNNLTTADRRKRKYVPSVDNNLDRRMLKTPEIKGNTSSDSAEPRRSNRRIQPTSRLLEGLQSSLIISKVPGEKAPRTNYRSATTTSRGKAQD